MSFLKNKKIQKETRTAGFTLIEVLVSLSIFTIVVTISVSVLLVLIDASSRAQNSQSIITNLSFALDSMTREIRTGSDYYCDNYSSELPVDGVATRDCETGGTTLSITEGGQSLTGNTTNDSRRIAYRLNTGQLERRLGDGDGIGDSNELSDWISVTSDAIDIETLEFYVTGSTRGLADEETPTVTVYLSGVIGDDDKTRTPFNIQTTIAQRILDI